MAFAMRQEAMACTSSRANPVAAANARRGAAARPARPARAPLGKAKAVSYTHLTLPTKA